MTEFSEFLSQLGLLHDCTVTLFEWQPEKKKFVFEIENLYWNFEGLPEYRGPKPGQISLEDVQRVEINIESNERSLRIYEFSVGREGSGMFNVLVTFSLAGKIAVTCQHAVFPDILLP